jgi:hypothetical protein
MGQNRAESGTADDVGMAAGAGCDAQDRCDHCAREWRVLYRPSAMKESRHDPSIWCVPVSSVVAAPRTMVLAGGLWRWPRPRLSRRPSPPTDVLVNGGFEAQVISGNSVNRNAGSSALTGWTIGGNSINRSAILAPAEARSRSTSTATSLGPSPNGRDRASRSYTLSFGHSAHPDLGGTPPRWR